MSPAHLAAALLMVTIWGFNFIVIRWGLNEIPPLLLTLLRFVLAAFPAVLFVKPPRAPWYLIAGYGLFAFALQFSFLFAGMAFGMPPGLSSLVIQVQAFFTIALVAALMQERPRPPQIAGAAVSAAGLVLVALFLPSGTALGFALVVAAALSWAIANLLVKRVPADAPLSVVVWGSAAALLPLSVAVLIAEGPARIVRVIAGLGREQWLGIAFQAWPTTLVAFGIWAWLLRRHPAATIAPFTLLVPIVGMSCAVWLLDEPTTWWKLTGGALVLAGLGLNLLAVRRPSRF
jgi:O-acetylserine/cysteine efflux transporter